MFLTFLSNKKSPAPLAYVLLHIGLCAGLVFVCPSMINYIENPMISLFWMIGLITLILYFVTHLRDPGFIPHDAIYLAERETPYPDSIKTRQRVDSILKLKSQHSSKPSLAFDNNTYSMTPEAKHRISEINKNYFKKLIGGDQAGNSITTNNIMLTNLATEGVPHCEKKNEDPEFYDQMKDDENYEDDLNQSVEEKEDENVVACEMSMDQADESMQQENILNFGADSGAEIESIDKTGSSPKRPTSLQLQSTKDLGDDKSPTSAKIKKKSQIKTTQAIEQRETSDTESKTKDNDQDHMKNIELTQLGQQNKRKRYKPFKDENIPQNTESPNKLSLPIHIIIPVSSPSNNAESIKSSERRFISTNDEETQSTHYGHTRNSSIKSHGALLSHRKLDEVPVKEEFENQKEEQDLLYVERRYCTVCGFEQPLRAKHCRDCNRCVAQYDHHCPWLGTCIGQKNHFVFYWFLIFQCIQLIWGEYEVFDYMITGEYQHWGSENVWRVVMALFITFFLIMVFSLICFHSYLACVNLTTWESLSWYKISYLREWHEDWGSPFDQGCTQNLKFFCCTQNNGIKIWDMPKFKRPLDEQDAQV